MECCCYLRNVQDHLADGRTPNEGRFGEPFKGPIIHFGPMVEYHPISPRDQARVHQFGKKGLLGIFLWHELIEEEFGKSARLHRLVRGVVGHIGCCGCALW